MSEEINQLILDKINESDAEENVKGFVRKILRYERTEYTGRGGSYTDEYEGMAEKMTEG